ncbi:MAG: TIGR00725 family protein [bacterium]|nr:TIGR00725 family protein [bacterium]
MAVVGAAECDDRLRQAACAVGEGLARAGAHLICGGRGGVMAAASRGARAAGGLVTGILPGADAGESTPNDDLSLALFTGMGQARNLSVVLSGAAVIAVGGGWGTLSEIALALKHGIPVVTLESWSLSRPDGRNESLLRPADSPRRAVKLALELAIPERLG